MIIGTDKGRQWSCYSNPSPPPPKKTPKLLNLNTRQIAK